MIEESGRVVAIDPGGVWVEIQGKAPCSRCAANFGCGPRMLEGLGGADRCRRIRALSVMPLKVGDLVIVGIREDLLLSSALAVYLFPLLGLLGLGIVAQLFAFRELLVISSAFLGFISIWSVVRIASRCQMSDPALQPVVVRVLLDVP